MPHTVFSGWMREVRCENALFYLKKLWGFLDMPDGPVIGEMFWDNMGRTWTVAVFFWCGELWWFGLGWGWWQVVVLQKKCRRKHLT